MIRVFFLTINNNGGVVLMMCEFIVFGTQLEKSFNLKKKEQQKYISFIKKSL
jgi:hypothetical protein